MNDHFILCADAVMAVKPLAAIGTVVLPAESEQSREPDQPVLDIVGSAAIEVEPSLAAIDTFLQSGEQSRELEQPVTDVVEYAAIEVEPSLATIDSVLQSREPEYRKPEQSFTDLVESAAIEVEPSLAAVGTVLQSSELEQSHELEQPVMDVVESAAIEVEYREPDQPVTDVMESKAIPGEPPSGMCHLSVRSFYATSSRGRPLKRPVTSYSPPLEKKRRRR